MNNSLNSPRSQDSLRRTVTVQHEGFTMADPFAPRRRPGSSFISAMLATAIFRCWHLLIFFGAWSTLVTVLNQHNLKKPPLTFQSTLLTVVGTVLGFVISYRTTSSFERYNEGRKLWSQIILANRTFARTVWFHVPDPAPTATVSADEIRARAMIEKKTVINLLEAFAVAVKHYLRGEDGIYYQDLYYLVKYLPAYALPPTIPSHSDVHIAGLHPSGEAAYENGNHRPADLEARPAPGIQGATSFLYQRTAQLGVPTSTVVDDDKSDLRERDKFILARSDEQFLLPASMPPKFYIFDLFPFSLLVRYLTKRGKELKGKKAARLRARMQAKAISHNLPLEISLYLSSYIASLQKRKITDVPTINSLFAALNNLVDGLTGLERILTTPIPPSYAIHLWLVTIIYCLALPLQIWATMRWITIPATTILSFFFFGFLVAGEEIENPFGYDRNDLNMDHFTHNIIRNELRAITATAPPDPTRWAFSPENDLLFARGDDMINASRTTPAEWIKKGYTEMQRSLKDE